METLIIILFVGYSTSSEISTQIVKDDNFTWVPWRSLEKLENITSSEVENFEIEYNRTAYARLVGGYDANVGEFPYLVSLQRGPGRHFCGGSIVDEIHIITACHCVRGMSAWQILVVAGAHNMRNFSEPFQQRIRADYVVENPKYHTLFSFHEFNHDSAIITLRRPLVWTEWVKPIRLAPKGHIPWGTCITAGWGNTLPLGNFFAVTPEVPRKGNITLIPRPICGIPYLAFTRSLLTSNMLCGMGLIKGTCNGDSGGPLVCKDLPGEPYLAGMTSFGVPPCGNPAFPDIFTNVAQQRDFIDPEIGVNNTSGLENNGIIRDILTSVIEVLPIPGR